MRCTLVRVAVSGLVAVALACSREDFEVTLLTFNDFHGALEDGGREPGSGRPWGGAIALAARVRAERQAEQGAVFLLDAGDAWQGTPASDFSYGRSTVEYLNRLGVDAAALGNHEFDWGIDTLRARLAEMRFPMLAANVYEMDGGRPAWARGTAIVARGGIRLGIIGFITPDTPKVTLPQNVESLRFPPPQGQIDSLVASVRSQGADLVVLLCHLGAWHDSSGAIVGPLAALAARARGVDAIVGGHTHTYVAGHVAGIPVVVAGTKGRGLGKIVLHWDGKRVRAAEPSCSPVFADSLPTAPDTAVAAFVDKVRRETAPHAQQVVAHTAERLDVETLAQLIAAAMRHRVQADVAVTNLGGVRTEFEPGDITEADVFELVPFENTLVTGWMRGGALRDLIACNPGAARLSGLRWRDPAARRGPWSGDRIEPRASGTPPQRPAADLVDDAGRPLAPEREYLVVTNNFLAHGGDGFEGFLAARELRWTEHRVRDVVREALRRSSAAASGSDKKKSGDFKGG